jgi:hypothetical protein
VVATGRSNLPIQDTARPLLLGKRNDGDGRNFALDGKLDEVAIWDRALSDAELSALRSRNPSSDPAFKITFDPNATDPAVNLVGNPKLGNGVQGKGLELHGLNGEYAVRPSDDGILDFGLSDFTIQASAKFNQPEGREQVLLEKLEGQGSAGWTLTKLSDNRIAFWAAPGIVLRSAPQALSNEWHRFSVRAARGHYEVFMDGKLIASSDSLVPIRDTTMPLLMGKRNAADGRNFALDGSIDEITIWNYAVSDERL